MTRVRPPQARYVFKLNQRDNCTLACSAAGPHATHQRHRLTFSREINIVTTFRVDSLQHDLLRVSLRTQASPWPPAPTVAPWAQRPRRHPTHQGCPFRRPYSNPGLLPLQARLLPGSDLLFNHTAQTLRLTWDRASNSGSSVFRDSISEFVRSVPRQGRRRDRRRIRHTGLTRRHAATDCATLAIGSDTLGISTGRVYGCAVDLEPPDPRVQAPRQRAGSLLRHPHAAHPWTDSSISRPEHDRGRRRLRRPRSSRELTMRSSSMASTTRTDNSCPQQPSPPPRRPTARRWI